MRDSRSGDPQWAIGAYSTSTGNAVEGTTWTNLPASPSMNGVTSIQFMVNVGLTAAGTVTLTANNTSYNVAGIVFQCVDYYSAPTTNFPDVNVVFIVSRAGHYYYFYYLPYWPNANIGTGSVSQSVSYATHSSDTGWWCIAQGNYLGVLTTTAFLTPDFNPSGPIYTPGPFTWSLTSLSTTSSLLQVGTAYWNPSVAVEVAEGAYGNFFADNPNFDAEANAGASAIYYYGMTGTNHFNIGADAPPATAYGSGLKRTQGSGSTYYDELGTSSGINNWMSSNWQISSPTKTQTGATNLPNLNVQYYLTMKASGGGSVSPSSGYNGAGSQVQISATSKCDMGTGLTVFDGWTGSGSGSYTGFNNPATITMNGVITETAKFVTVISCPHTPIG